MLVGEMSQKPAHQASICHNRCPLSDGGSGKSLPKTQDCGGRQDFALKALKGEGVWGVEGVHSKALAFAIRLAGE